MTGSTFLGILEKENKIIRVANNRIDEVCKSISSTLANKISKALGETYVVVYSGKLNFCIRPKSEESFNNTEIFTYRNDRISEIIIRCFCPSARKAKMEVILDDFFDKQIEL